MFICAECLKEHYEDVFAISRSYGACDSCGKAKACFDIPSSRLTRKKTLSDGEYKSIWRPLLWNDPMCKNPSSNKNIKLDNDMFGSYKKLIKSDLIIKFKTQLIELLEEEMVNLNKIEEWKDKVYFNNGCMTKMRFEEERLRHLKYFHEQYRIGRTRIDLTKNVIETIENYD